MRKGLLDFSQMVAKKAEALGQADGGEDFLPGGGVLQKATADEVDQGMVIFQVAEKFFHLAETGFPRDFDLLKVFENFGHEGIADDGVGRNLGLGVLEGLGGGDDVGPDLDEVFEPDARQSLEDEIGSTVGLLDARTDQTQAAHPAGRPLRVFHGDGKHPRALQSFAEHCPISGLKNPQG
jgi:hypothetical protein